MNKKETVQLITAIKSLPKNEQTRLLITIKNKCEHYKHYMLTKSEGE